MSNKNTHGITRRAGLGLLAGAGAAAPLLGRGLGSDLTIGALLSLTGDWSTLGITSKALLEIVVAEMNASLEATQSSGRVSLRVEDTKLEPERAVSGFKALTGAGASLIIGPQSSAECRAILPLLDAQGTIAISQGSTAGSLSLPGRLPVPLRSGRCGRGRGAGRGRSGNRSAHDHPGVAGGCRQPRHWGLGAEAIHRPGRLCHGRPGIPDREGGLSRGGATDRQPAAGELAGRRCGRATLVVRRDRGAIPRGLCGSGTREAALAGERRRGPERAATEG